MKGNFTVIYSFQVQEGKEAQFIAAWKGLTKLIYEHRGSLGSRLHKFNESEYIAYAVWPDRDTFNDVNRTMPESADQFRAAMREACSNIETKYELDVVEDLICDRPHS